MTKIIYVDGLEVFLTRKRIRNINMRIKDPDGRIVVSAPYLTPESEVIRFIRSRRNWIDKSRAAIIERAAAYPEPENRAEKEARRRDLKRRIAERLPYIEEVTGLRCSGWTVRDMKSRWGSCNTATKHINLSLMLAEGTFAFKEDAQYSVENGNLVKELTFDTLEKGTWYIGVQCEDTVVNDINSTYGLSYSGKLAALNGAPYTIQVSWE